MMDQIEYEKALELLQKAEPSWKGTITPANQSDLYTRPPEPRINRFRFDDGLSMAGSGASNGSDNQNPSPDPPLDVEAYECSGNKNGEPSLLILYGPSGQ